MHRFISRICVALTLMLVSAGAVAAGPGQASAATAALNQPTVSSTTWDYYRHFTDPPVYDGPITVGVSGGTAPYTFLWERIPGSDTTTTASNPAGSSTSFRKSISHGGVYISYWRCLVTDNAGNAAYTATVTVTFEWENGD